MNFLIAGLGNIGVEYANTRHNIGFMVLDALVKESGTSFISGRYGSTAEISYRGQTHIAQAFNLYELERKGCKLLDAGTQDKT